MHVHRETEGDGEDKYTQTERNREYIERWRGYMCRDIGSWRRYKCTERE